VVVEVTAKCKTIENFQISHVRAFVCTNNLNMENGNA